MSNSHTGNIQNEIAKEEHQGSLNAKRVVPVDNNGYIIGTSNSATVTSVNDTATSTTLLAANTARREAIIQNDSSSTLYIKLGTTASATDYTVKLGTDDIFITAYTGRIDGIWSADSSGAAKITSIE